MENVVSIVVFEAAQLSPFSRHFFKASSPELSVESLERQFRQRRTDRSFEVVAQVSFTGRYARFGNRLPFRPYLRATGKLQETCAVQRKRHHREIRPQSRSLINVPLLELEQAMQER